jgi:type I restriction enzyme S subunit
VSEEPKLPTKWVFSTIGKVCEPSQYGYTAKASSSGRTHYLRTTDITAGLINWASVPYCDIPVNEEPKYLLNDGDVVISRAGSVGFSCLILNPAKSVFASYLIRFRPLILPKYFSYFLDTPTYWESVGERSLGIAVQNVNATNLSEIQIPIAPKAEQIRIVEKLEELFSDLDAGVAELKAAQKKLAQYRQSLLKAAVVGELTAEWREKNKPKETGAKLLERILKERRSSWEEKQLARFKEQGKTPPKGWQDKYPEPVQPDTTNLQELPEGWVWASLNMLTEFITSGSRGWADYYSTEGAIFIRSQNINKDWLDLSDIAFVSPPANSEGARTRVRLHDLLLTITGANVGKSAQVAIELEEAYVSQHVALLRPVEVSLSYYLHLYLTSVAGGRGQLDKEAYGAGKPGLNLQQVAAVVVPLPSSNELAAIEGIVEQQLSAIAEQNISLTHSHAQAAAQRKNILKSAFSGQLVAQDPNDEPACELLERIRSERQSLIKNSKKTGTPRRKQSC